MDLADTIVPDCDNFIRNTGALVEDGCSMPCAGDDEQICGGPNRMTVLKSDAEPPVLAEVQTYNEWTTEGCYTYVRRVL